MFSVILQNPTSPSRLTWLLFWLLMDPVCHSDPSHRLHRLAFFVQQLKRHAEHYVLGRHSVPELNFLTKMILQLPDFSDDVLSDYIVLDGADTTSCSEQRLEAIGVLLLHLSQYCCQVSYTVYIIYPLSNLLLM